MADIMEARKARSFTAQEQTSEGDAPVVSMQSMLSALADGDSSPDTAEAQAENAAPAPVVTPLDTHVTNMVNPAGSYSGHSTFSKVEVGDAAKTFAKQWLPSMDTPSYIGESDMLLSYLQRLERLHKITMPIKACGVDPIVFENIIYAGDKGTEYEKLFSIPHDPNSGSTEEGESIYELITVDNDLYLSCASDCLDEDYLNRILSDATASVKETGEYIFKMVGYRKLALDQGQSTARLLSTLRLNSFEMSVLITYMEQFEGISVSYETINDHQCIVFRL